LQRHKLVRGQLQTTAYCIAVRASPQTRQLYIWPESRDTIPPYAVSRTQLPVCLKIEIHEIHLNLRNPMWIINKKNPTSATTATFIRSENLSKSNARSHM